MSTTLIKELMITAFENLESFKEDPDLSSTLLYLVGSLSGAFALPMTLPDDDPTLAWLREYIPEQSEIWNSIMVDRPAADSRVTGAPTDRFKNGHGLIFLARLVEPGVQYGAQMSLVNKDRTVVEFYDTRFNFCYDYEGTPDDARDAGAPCLGQFMASFSLEQLLLTSDELDDRRNQGGGLCLYGGVPAWRLSAPALRYIVDWAKAKTEKHHAVL